MKPRDREVIALVGLAHGTSHFFHLMLPPLFPWLMRDFLLSYTDVGLLTTTFFVISGVGQALAGFVYEPVGAATYYHTFAVHPWWDARVSEVAQIGAMGQHMAGKRVPQRMAGLALRQLDGGALQGAAERGNAGGELTMSPPMHSQPISQLCRDRH